MRILYLRLVNFESVKAAMGLRDIHLDFRDIDKPIIRLYGENRCGKTVLIHQLHPFSSINLNGDERSDLSLIIQGENGLKEIVYDVDGELYYITHTYKATPSGKNHTVTSSIKHNGEELNTNGGVNTFNQLVEQIFGINKYRFQFIINGTQLTSFANRSSTERKTILSKAKGIDIYEKIHKLATDDYRYTSKTIQSLSHTQEYLLSTYGSYETLVKQLEEKRRELSRLEELQADTRSRMDHLGGKLQTLRAQNPFQELQDIERQCDAYTNAVSALGGRFDPKLYDELVEEQIRLNQQIADLRGQYSILLHDIDDRYAKKHELESMIARRQQAIDDVRNMEMMEQNLITRISEIEIIESLPDSSDYLRSMISLAQAINSICKEIVSCLTPDQVRLFNDMIQKDIDISAFLIQEGSVLMDTEKEKSVVSRMQSMLHAVNGEEPENCRNENCLYRKTYDQMMNYFKSYHSVEGNRFTQYDMEQFDHANKNINTIQRMIRPNDISETIRDMFTIKQIMVNLTDGRVGVDVSRLTFLMEEAAKIEQRKQFVKQLSDIQSSLEKMRSLLPISDEQGSTKSLADDIRAFQSQKDEIKQRLDQLSVRLEENDRKRYMLSEIKNVNISSLQKRRIQLRDIIQSIDTADQEYSALSEKYRIDGSLLNQVQTEFDTLEKANAQYMKTMSEIRLHSDEDQIYKAIAEATSSTKGKPVITIRETVHQAMNMANQLLDVMYGSEIQLLEPTIDETEFSLPFRCGVNKSQDIRYGSQSESTLLSFAISLSLAAITTNYNVALVDEIDAYLDENMKDGFVLMLQEIMIKLKMEQLFVISHSMGSKEQYSHIMHTVDISNKIKELKGGD